MYLFIHLQRKDLRASSTKSPAILLLDTSICRQSAQSRSFSLDSTKTLGPITVIAIITVMTISTVLAVSTIITVILIRPDPA